MSEDTSLELDNNEDVISSNDQGTVVVGEGVRLDGRIENAKDTHIAGVYNGSVKSENINISDRGNLKGEIKTEDLTISGTFEGDIKVDKSMIVNSKAKVKGNIEYSLLEVKFGATIEGNIKHSAAVSSMAKPEESTNTTNENKSQEAINEEIH